MWFIIWVILWTFFFLFNFLGKFILSKKNIRECRGKHIWSITMLHLEQTKMKNQSWSHIFWKLRLFCHRLLRFQVDCKLRIIRNTILWKQNFWKKSYFFYLNNAFSQLPICHRISVYIIGKRRSWASKFVYLNFLYVDLHELCLQKERCTGRGFLGRSPCKLLKYNKYRFYIADKNVWECINF